ncbi:MAG: hypothetical protein HFG72_07350 [Hungatella sp.]|nr:hypothetical protein [Hungatella sp.]
MRKAGVAETPVTTTPAEDASVFVKKLGRITFIVRIHFSKTSRETMSDKIKRVPKNEIQKI